MRQTGQYFPEIQPPVQIKYDEQGNEVPANIQPDIPPITANDLIVPHSGNRIYTEEAELSGYGQSKYDNRSGFQPNVDLEDIRAREQSWGSKVLNGTLKGAVTFGTTFANSTAGLAAGVATSLFGYTPIGQLINTGNVRSVIPGSKQQEFPEIKDAIQAGVNNKLSQTFVNWQRLAEDVFPNFRTAEERTEEYQRDWLKPSHLFSGNSIGDAFIKNLGFTAGAMVGFGSWRKLLGKAAAGKLAGNAMKDVAMAADGDAEALAAVKGAADAVQRGAVVANGATLAKNINSTAWRAAALPPLKQLEYGVISAMGEGNAEGLMAREEYLEESLPELEQWFKQEYDALEERMLQMENPNRQKVFAQNEYGQFEPIQELTDDEKETLLAQRNQLYDEYRSRRQKMMEEADKLAMTTFGLNIPILTVSNLMEFSRILGGGWRSARKAAGRVAGRVAFDESGKAIAKYNEKNVLRSIGRVATGIGKISGAEAAEEMEQGFVSSGAKKIADDRLTFFNDMGYNSDALQSFRSDWLGSMVEGGSEYLSDWKNWQEGFMGALTGLLGMPGRGYFRGERGGLAQAIVDAKQDINNWNSSANKLNELVNSEDFQNRWRGYIRHLAFDDQIKNAVARDDEYLFHCADDNQLFNDVMTFAKAGRIDDLRNVADRFSQLSDDDIQNIRELRKQSGEKIDETSNEEIRDSVQNQADRIKKTIKDYTKIRNELLVRLPVGSPEEMVDESVFTGLQVTNAEERFLGLLNETLDALDSTFAAKINKPEKSEEYRQELENLKSRYTKVFAGSLVPVDAATRKADNAKLDELRSLVGNNKGLAKKVDDMIKLYQDRQRFFDKVSRLENTTPEQYQNQAKTQAKEQQKATEEARKQDAKAYAAQLDEKAGGVDTVEQMHRIYSDPTTNRGVFIDSMRERSKNNEQAKQFVDLYDTFEDFKDAIIAKHPKIVGRNGKMNYVAEALLNQLFNRANSQEEFVKALDNVALDRDGLNAALNVMVQSGAITEDEALPQLVDSFYNATVAAVQDTAPDFISGWKGTSDRKNLSDVKPEDNKQQVIVDDNANPAPATVPDAETIAAKPEKQETVVEPEPAEAEPEKTNDDAPEPISAPSPEESASDANSAYRDESIPEQQALRQDSKGAVKLGYYQQSIPEIPTRIAREVRDLLLARKTASSDEIKAIDETIASYDLYNFVVFDNEGKAVGGEVGYADTYKWLEDNNAFEYTSTKLNPGDEVVLAISENAPKYNGQNQIIVAAVKERNADGEIIDIQPLTVLHSTDKSGDYMNLDELYDAIYADYDSTEPEGSMYIFGGKKNPKTSRVWGKRPGLVRYDRKGPGKRIDEIPAYDASAPIMVYGDNNQPILLRGNIDPSKIYMPNLYSWSKDHYGRLYYLVKSGDNGYTPILIEKATYTADMLRNAPDNTFLANIRDRVTAIDNLTSEVGSGYDISKANDRLKTILGKLNQYINLDGISFEYADAAEPYLNIHWVEAREVQGQQFFDEYDRKVLPGESLIPLFDNILSRPPRLSPKQKWLNTSKHHLGDYIDAGLLTSNAQELRQVGVNFMYDPWDAESGTFKQVLPSQRQEQRPISKAEPQVVAKDAELGDDLSEFDAQIASVQESQPVEQDTSLPQNLDDFFGGFEENEAQIQNEPDLDFAELSAESRDALKQKGVSEKVWNESDRQTREHLLFC